MSFSFGFDLVAFGTGMGADVVVGVGLFAFVAVD